MEIHIEFEAVEISFESNDSGEVTAYNDDLRVMAVGPDEATAARRFREALTFQVARDLAAGRPLPDLLRAHVRTLVHA